MKAQAYEPTLQQASRVLCLVSSECSHALLSGLQTTQTRLGGGRICTDTKGSTLNSIHCQTPSCPRLVQLWMLRQPDAGGTFMMAGNPPQFLSDTWKGDSGSPLLVPNTTDASRDMQVRVARAS